MTLPHRPPRLQLGQEFVDPTTGERWRVTDLGTRTFLAINLSDPKVIADPSWANGPPYAVVEHVWDETDYGVLEGEPGIEWEDDEVAAEPNACTHPATSRLGFFPSSTDGGHERCLDCDGIRYQQRRDGPWWPWTRQVSVEEEEGSHGVL